MCLLFGRCLRRSLLTVTAIIATTAIAVSTLSNVSAFAILRSVVLHVIIGAKRET